MSIIISSKNVEMTTATIVGISDGVQYRLWDYKLGSGAWTAFSAGASYSASKNLTGLSANTTYTFQIRGVDTSTGLTVTSSSGSFTTKNAVAPTMEASVSNITTTGFTIIGTSLSACKTWQYQLNGGSWESLSTTSSATTVNKAITGLTPGTTYTVRVRATRVYNGLLGTSSIINATTTAGASVLNSVNTVTIDAATPSVTFNWTVQLGTGYTHSLTIRNGTTDLVNITGLTGTSGSQTIDLTTYRAILLAPISSTTTNFTASFDLKTFNGGTQVGSTSSKNAIIQVIAANSAPTFTGFTVSELNTKVSAKVPAGTYVQSASNIRITCALAAPKNGAAIDRYVVTIGSKTIATDSAVIDFGTADVYGENCLITVYVQDTRGYQTAVTPQEKTFLRYSRPIITEWQARREDSIGEKTDLLILGSIAQVAFAGEDENKLEMAEYNLRQIGEGTSFEGWETLSGKQNLGTTYGRINYKYDINNWAELLADKSYEVQLRFQDSFEIYSNIITFIIARGTPLMSFREGKIGINQHAPQVGLEVNGGAYINDGFVSWSDASVLGNLGVIGDIETMSAIKATGRSSSWGITSGLATAGVNIVMGTASGATWLISGASDGEFRAGWQVHDAGTSMRFYLGSNYYTLTGTSGTIYHTGNITYGTSTPTSLASGNIYIKI